MNGCADSLQAELPHHREGNWSQRSNLFPIHREQSTWHLFVGPNGGTGAGSDHGRARWLCLGSGRLKFQLTPYLSPGCNIISEMETDTSKV